MSDKFLWSDDKIEAFLAQTIGREVLAKSPEEAIKYAAASAKVIAGDYEARDAKKRECADIALQAIDKVLLASNRDVSPQMRAQGLHLALESIRISFLIIRDL